MVDLLEVILQCTYEKDCTLVRSGDYKVIEQILFDLSRRKVIDDIFGTPIANILTPARLLTRFLENKYVQMPLQYQSLRWYNV